MEQTRVIDLGPGESREIAFECCPPLEREAIVRCRWTKETMLQIVAWSNDADKVTVSVLNPYSVPHRGVLACTLFHPAVSA